MSDPTDIVEYLRKNAVFNYRDTYLKAADEIEQLRKERDEARREICKNVAAISASMNAKQWAQERGWDCFKEKTDE